MNFVQLWNQKQKKTFVELLLQFFFPFLWTILKATDDGAELWREEAGGDREPGSEGGW